MASQALCALAAAAGLLCKVDVIKIRADLIMLSVQNIDALQQAGAMALLRPLLLDSVPR